MNLSKLVDLDVGAQCSTGTDQRVYKARTLRSGTGTTAVSLPESPLCVCVCVICYPLMPWTPWRTVMETVLGDVGHRFVAINNQFPRIQRAVSINIAPF